MKSLSIRVRLTFWYGMMLAATLIGCGIVVYVMANYGLIEGVDRGLGSKYEEIAEWVEKGTDVDEVAGPAGSHRQQYLIRLKTPDGTTLVESKVLRGVETIGPISEQQSGEPAYFVKSLSEGGRHRFLSDKVHSSQGDWFVQIGTSLEQYEQELSELRFVLLTVLPIGMLAAIIGGYWLAGRALQPIHRITETTRKITAQNLAERIPVANNEDELGRLADTLNAMIGRLDHAFDAMRQFTADASHELLTPLTAMRTETEVALRADRPAEQYRRVLTSILEEVERLTKLADSLLLLSREDTHAIQLCRKPVQLDEVIRGVVEHTTVLADAANVKLEVGQLPRATVEADVDCLRQVFFNLLDNAVKYTQPGGSVTVCGHATESDVTVEVSDTGSGIPPESLPRVFDRFYRVDKSRSRQMGGTGLGLSICKSLIERHDGRIEVESAVGKGSTFRVILPTIKIGGTEQ
jgi:heavy metal sensor kinase